MVRETQSLLSCYYLFVVMVFFIRTAGTASLPSPVCHLWRAREASVFVKQRTCSCSLHSASFPPELVALPVASGFH